jgi:ribosomal protein L11 methyltransferase
MRGGMTASWKLTLPCTRVEAETLTGEQPLLEAFDPPPILMTSEPDPSRPDEWRLDVYVAEEPSQVLIAAVRRLVPSALAPPVVERIVDEDWITLSQAGLEPVSAGRFFVHTAKHAGSVPAGALALQIEAGLAFGTGQHATTTGCLLELDAVQGPPRNALDLGTGTAILALAIAKKWPTACVTASDNDPVAIRVSAENIAINGMRTGSKPGEILLTVAEGLADPQLTARGPYDLVVANILAGPLIELAPAISGVLAPGGTLLLAGVLDVQADRVEAAYEHVGLVRVARRPVGEWPTLRLQKT